MVVLKKTNKTQAFKTLRIPSFVLLAAGHPDIFSSWSTTIEHSMACADRKLCILLIYSLSCYLIERISEYLSPVYLCHYKCFFKTSDFARTTLIIHELINFVNLNCILNKAYDFFVGRMYIFVVVHFSGYKKMF